jgi:hypothetical protein
VYEECSVITCISFSCMSDVPFQSFSTLGARMKLSDSLSTTL